jgi:DNA-directed RNA polymerase specialized sigma24 family protein
MVDFSPANKSCSFCGKQGTKDTKFAGGLGAMMCADCVHYYSEVFASEERIAAITRPPWDHMSDAEILATLPLIEKAANQVNEFLGEWVALARERKLSWTEIGSALGVSRQAVWQRFARAVPDSKDASA